MLSRFNGAKPSVQMRPRRKRASRKIRLRRTFQGHPITIGFNSAYLLDVLKTASAGDLGFEFKDGQSAGQLLRTAALVGLTTLKSYFDSRAAWPNGCSKLR
jgi:DNA polymerase III beta subunit, C-terminal domain